MANIDYGMGNTFTLYSLKRQVTQEKSLARCMCFQRFEMTHTSRLYYSSRFWETNEHNIGEWHTFLLVTTHLDGVANLMNIMLSFVDIIKTTSTPTRLNCYLLDGFVKRYSGCKKNGRERMTLLLIRNKSESLLLYFKAIWFHSYYSPA